MSKPNGVHMCLHLTQIAIIWQFSTVLIGFCHYCYIAQSNCTQIVQMRRPVLNTSLHIVHFLYGFFLSGLLKFFLMCNVLLFILKMQKNDMMICCFFWSLAQLRKKKNMNWWGYIMMLWSHFVRVIFWEGDKIWWYYLVM